MRPQNAYIQLVNSYLPSPYNRLQLFSLEPIVYKLRKQQIIVDNQRMIVCSTIGGGFLDLPQLYCWSD